jgi:hypothetical protein
VLIKIIIIKILKTGGWGGKGQRKKSMKKKNFIPSFIFILCVEWPNYQKIKIK